MKLKIFICIISVFSLVVLIYFENHSLPSDNLALVQNRITTENHIQNALIVPDFNFTVFDIPSNELIYKNFYDIKTSDIIIHFWATWCNVCKKELPDLIHYAQQHPDTTILAISIDDDISHFMEYMVEIKDKANLAQINNLLFVSDNTKEISLGLFNTEIVPENYFIKFLNNQYIISDKKIGKYSW